MPLLFERSFPILGGLLIAAAYLATPLARNYQLPESVSALMAAIVSIGGISVGFLATAKSILISIDDKEIVKRLKATGYYKRIVGYLRAAIFWSFLLTIYSAAALLVDLKSVNPWTIYRAAGFAGWLFLAATATLSYFRVASIYYSVLNTLAK